MGVKINIASYLPPFTNNTTVMEVKANTVGDCISQLVKQFTDIGKMLFDMSGKLHSYVGIYVNGDDTILASLSFKPNILPI